jgi:RimJ/RimL family protein N-acetyltransferase
MIKYPIFYTDRLMLRKFEISDAPKVQKLAGLFEIADTTLSIPHPYPDRAAEEWIKSHKSDFRKKKAIHFAIVQKLTSELIGAIGLSDIEESHSRAEMGYWIAKEYWNQGFATEAARAVLDYAFADLNLQRVYAHHFKRNSASGKVLKKIGMQEEGILRSHIQKWGKFEDIVIYGIVSSKLPKE